jgi:trehalose 6-phosphate synthase
MHLFRLRLIIALVACVALVSIASTYFEVLAHKHQLRGELERRSREMEVSLQPVLAQAFAEGNSAAVPGLLAQAKAQPGTLGMAVYDTHGNLLGATAPAAVLQSLTLAPVQRSFRKGADSGAFGQAGNVDWLEESLPLHDGKTLVGALVLVVDASYIRSQGNELWRRSIWRAVALVVLLTGVTFLMVRWFLMRPMTRVAERLRWLRIG